MLPGQLLPGQMSPWQLESVQDGPRILLLKFGQNWVINSWDIADIEFVWVVVVGGGGPKSFYCQTQLLLGWIEVELGFWQQKNLEEELDVTPV